MKSRRTFAKALAACVALVALGCERESPPAAAVGTTAAQPRTEVPASKVPEGGTARVPLLEQDLAYGEAKSRNLVGFLAMPADAAEPLPAVIVIHEWWGLNDKVKAMTRRLASEGYVALAVDLYGGATAEKSEQAQALMAQVISDPDAARANLRQAYEYLDKYALAPRIGSIGWGFGGGWSLQTAMIFPTELDATVMYYGQFVTDAAALQPVDVPILGIYGAADESNPARDVMAFRTLLTEQLHKNAKVLIYPNAKQAFASEGGANYNTEIAAQAWEETMTFLRDNLKARKPGQ